MTNRKSQIIRLLEEKQAGMNAGDIAKELNIDRTNVSRYLNELHKENKVIRIEGRPVLFELYREENQIHVDLSAEVSFENLVGTNESLKVSIQQAKAAMLYPPRGLHTIIFGETGTGKSLFAECMFNFAVSSQTLSPDAPFVSFNCADYVQNPQLLFAHIFGVKKGAYTGATEDSQGLMAKADGGVLFLDEIHRLPPEGQEMLFTFIDKGTYRPLGETEKTYEASVQIIGATTESSDIFLTTFNRRIPMAITLPSLKERSIDERYEIVSLFIKQEANRLNQKIQVDRDAILAFMLYDAEGNIGQVKRDLKLVCAKAFLHYRTHQEDHLFVHQKDLPLPVQKGLLKVKEIPERVDRYIDKQSQSLTFEPGAKDVVWSQDPTRNMEVYNTIEEKVQTLSIVDLEDIDLESLIATDVDKYFQTYVEELSRNDIHQDLISQQFWQLTDRLYDIAETRLERKYNEKARFAFALHLQSTVDRIAVSKNIIHPNLNDVRKHYSKEFQVAIELSGIIEEEFSIEIPFDEIGFITMFLSIDIGEKARPQENEVAVVVLMHGKSTASSMLETVQELLGTATGMAFNMPLTMEVQQMYDQLKNYVEMNRESMTSGLILLTDMGSLNSFGNMIYEETGVRTKEISMVSTMIVLEAVRMASVGRSLEDIYQNIQMSFEGIVREQFRSKKTLKKAVVVTCFTGEGVAAKLYERIQPVVNESKIEIIQMQFLEKESFKKHIDELMETYEIKVIVGTVDVEYQNIPFFSAFDIFDNEKLNVFKRIAADEVPIEQLLSSLTGTIKSVDSLEQLLISLQSLVHKTQTDLKLIVEPGVDAGIIIHLAFMIDSIIQGKTQRDFKELAEFKKKFRIELNSVRTNLMVLEKQYKIEISESETAILTQMFIENRINQEFINAQ